MELRSGRPIRYKRREQRNQGMLAPASIAIGRFTALCNTPPYTGSGTMKPETLIEYAIDAMDRAYCPYSGYKVGAALLGADGKVYTGCNIENASFSPTICAERTAFAKAVSEGCREFAAIAVCGGKNGVITDLCTPCGVCRQVMAEFCCGDFPVYLTDGKGLKMRTLKELLPDGFKL